MSRFGILYPNGSQTSTFGSWVLRNNRSKLTLFSPDDPYKDQTKNLVLDLAVQGVEQARLGDLPNTKLKTTPMDDDLKIINVDYLSKHWSDLIIILKIS